MFKLFKFKESATTTDNSTTGIPDDATLQQLKDELLGLMAQESTNHYRMGQIYNHIVEKKLAEQAGFKDARDFFSKNLADLSQTALTLYGAVADAFTEPVARRFGVTCLYLLLTYKEVASIQVNHQQPGDTLIEVPDDKGVVSTLPFGSCSVSQMRAAIRIRRKPTSSKPLPPEAEARAEQYRSAVLARFPKGNGTRVKVGLRNDKGSAVLDFTGIPLEQADGLLEALKAMKSSRQ
ncbi:hypothetical protein [Hyalangium gracile]|uniref:hypothetical protein n=1 Tax=Hyalangium gracile TaxID=394092 RepID=UPI001CC8ED7B|nr:hypothetical protein [Hyalangium gracile]